MRQVVLRGALALLLAAGVGCAAPAVAPDPPVSPVAAGSGAQTVLVRDDLASVFTDAGVTGGTFVLRDAETGQLTVVDEKLAHEPAIPASTFKVAHALIALETGVVADVDEVIPYGGQPQPIEDWERDMSMREAVPASNVPIFQELARRIGIDRELEWLERLGYGNAQVGRVVDRFWLDGPLEISPVEQTEFLQRLAQRTLPASVANQDAVAEIVRLEQSPAGTLYGKTGWQFERTPQPGRWVGWVERADGRLFTFALYMDMDGAEDAALRVPLGRALLDRLDVLPAA